MPIHFEVRDEHVAVITIDRPERRNSLDLPHFSALAQAWRRVRDDDDLWVAIITGVESSFCVGADLRDFIPQITQLIEELESGEVTEFEGMSVQDSVEAVLRDVDLYKPVIAAINGVCVAGGMEMLGGCDIRIAVPDATFGVVEPRRGLFAGGGTTARLPRQISFPHAMEFLLTADRIPAAQAERMGLINEIVEPEQLMDRAMDWARRIMQNAPLAVQATKESVIRGLKVSLDEAYTIEMDLAARVFGTEDAQEGPKAFAEKRDPVWQGR